MRLIPAITLTCLFAPFAQGAAKLDFNRDIRPILSDNCFACHGLDAKRRKGDLRLDIPEGAYKKDKDGVVAVKPGDLTTSEVVKRILTPDADELMPPAIPTKN